MTRKSHKRRICFVTGSRAEFGLMGTTLAAIARRKGLELRTVATGMHLDPVHGDGLRAIAAAGWNVDAVVPWPASPVNHSASDLARVTGAAMGQFPAVFDRLGADIVLIVGDRVEAFAAAAAAHLSGRIVAHIHGGDRALGQVDDALRHAISKLAHVHFPATAASAARLRRLGEDAWRIHAVGSPGVDGIVAAAASRAAIRKQFAPLTAGGFALLVLHPTDADAQLERQRAQILLRATLHAGLQRVVIVYPNNDPGSSGIIGAWNAVDDPRITKALDLPRAVFLGLLRDTAVLAGNSSSGIIEAASFATPVIDVGPRQAGRERGRNVKNVPWDERRLTRALQATLRRTGPARKKAGVNVYGLQGAGRRIATILAKMPIDERLRRKLIAY